ncbi:MAG: alpha-E domain-containing protein [Actinomycetota bacterium]
MYEAPPPLLLSRVAESAYWAGRYLERAEGTARLVKAHADLVIDLPSDATVGWWPLLAVTGVGYDPDAPHDEIHEEDVVDELVVAADNPSSICSSVAAVHRNLRITRSVMPLDAAEVLIDLHHHVRDNAGQAIHRRSRNQFLTSVIRGCQTLSGTLAETMCHDDAFCFFTVGRQLERADLTTRVLDVHAGILHGRDDDALTPYHDLYWASTLRSVSALQAFRRRGQPASPATTLSFLLRDPKCPRTVGSCLIEASRWLLEIPRHDQAMAACAGVETLLQGVDVIDLLDGKLHDFVDELQLALSDLHQQVESTWFEPAPAALAG